MGRHPAHRRRRGVGGTITPPGASPRIPWVDVAKAVAILLVGRFWCVIVLAPGARFCASISLRLGLRLRFGLFLQERLPVENLVGYLGERIP